ncbi:MAG: hypothetical protein V4813_13425 [Gemmatimonadota bacterium]
MPRSLRSAGAIAGLTLLCVAAARPASAQSTIVATATVVGRPLMLRGVTIVGEPATLRVMVDGCGRGALTVDGRSPVAGMTRVHRQLVPASPRCERRELLVTLPSALRGDEAAWEVALVQDDGLLAPSVSQIVLSAGATRAAARSSLLH